MTRKEWEQIRKAADLLGLGGKASLAEIKKAYRSLSKTHHPDLQGNSKENVEEIKMHRLSEAYEILLHYCAEFHFPLVPGEDEQFEAEDWWFERFGKDHHWGKGGMDEEDGKK